MRRRLFTIAITDQILRIFVEGEGLDDLLCAPCRGRMGGDIEVDEPASVMPEHDEAVEQAERNRVNGEEVDRRDVFDANAKVRECYSCHQNTAWNDIKGVGWYKSH